ncbi:MAG: response regulator [Acidimicrobiales bacterium]
MPRVLLATDADRIHEEVDAALAGDDIEVLRLSRGVDVLPAVHELEPDLVVLDLQIGNMGGMAACMSIRLDESVDRLDHVPVLMLLDRDVDAFLAHRAEADGWIVKPLDAFRLRKAATAILAGEAYREGMADDEGAADEVDVPEGDASGPADEAIVPPEPEPEAAPA